MTVRIVNADMIVD